MSFFDNSDNVEPDLPFFSPGDYTLEVKSFEVMKTFNKKEYLVLKFKILESTSPQNKAGTQAVYMIAEDKFEKRSKHIKDAKLFIAAVVKVEPITISNENIKEALAGDLNGLSVRARATPVLKSDGSQLIDRKGNPFMELSFSSV